MASFLLFQVKGFFCLEYSCFQFLSRETLQTFLTKCNYLVDSVLFQSGYSSGLLFFYLSLSRANRLLPFLHLSFCEAVYLPLLFSSNCFYTFLLNKYSFETFRLCFFKTVPPICHGIQFVDIPRQTSATLHSCQYETSLHGRQQKKGKTVTLSLRNRRQQFLARKQTKNVDCGRKPTTLGNKCSGEVFSY